MIDFGLLSNRHAFGVFKFDKELAVGFANIFHEVNLIVLLLFLQRDVCYDPFDLILD